MKWKYFDGVLIKDKLALLGNGIRQSVVMLMCPKCSAIQEHCMVIYEETNDTILKGENIIPKYCCYCGKKLGKENKQ